MPKKFVSTKYRMNRKRDNSTRKKVINIDKRVKRIQSKEEIKFADVYQNGVSIGTTPVLTALNLVASGTDDNNRIGDSVHATSIQGRYDFISASAALAPTIIRMIVFWDRQPNGFAPTVSNVLDLSTISSSLYAPYHRSYQKRIKIIYDKVIVINPNIGGTTSGTTDALVPMAIYKRFKRKLNREVKYNDVSATITTIQTNSLYLLQVSNNNTNPPLVVAGYRFYYKDQ